MFKQLLISGVLVAGLNAVAAEGNPMQVVDLRESRAIEELQRTNPAHYEKIRRAIAALQEQPKLAEGNWLQVNVDAVDVDLSRYLIRTSNPPKQLLQFTIDDTRYVMHLVRTDMTPEMTRAR
jgi:hypothetical protein